MKWNRFALCWIGKPVLRKSSLLNCYEEQIRFVRKAASFLQAAGELFQDSALMDDFQQWSGIFPDDERERDYLSIVAATLENPVSARHAEFLSKIYKQAKKQDVEREVFAEIQMASLITVRYEIFTASGYHRITLPWKVYEWPDGFISLDDQDLLECDQTYCCEMCNGERVVDPRESHVPGFYTGWMIKHCFIALARIDRQSFLKLDRFQESSSDELTRVALCATLRPWEM